MTLSGKGDGCSRWPEMAIIWRHVRCSYMPPSFFLAWTNHQNLLSRDRPVAIAVEIGVGSDSLLPPDAFVPKLAAMARGKRCGFRIATQE